VSITGERWQQLQLLFEQAAEIAPEQRAPWLAGLDVDPAMRDELARMLAADATVHTLRGQLGAAIADAVHAPQPGERIGPWRLLRELGSGGMGTVFLVERADGTFTRQAALKLIRGVATRESIRQLRHERQVLAGLEHPGIARLLDGGETLQGQPYLVLEYVRGEPLTQAVRNRRLALRPRLALLREVALAVHHAHQQLIIHRDIKPANVLLRDDGRPVLLDFGIAKLLGAEAGELTGTQRYFTPAYASPEQKAGRPVGTATDVHALGLLLLELLTDAAPAFDAGGRVRPPSELAPPARRSALRGDLDCIVARACARDPGRRYASAAALAEDIERHLAGLPIRAAPDSRWYVASKFVRRHPVSSAITIAAVVLLALSGWRVVDERNRARAAEVLAERQAQDARAVTDYLVGLFHEADPGAARGQPLTPSELIDRGVARLGENDEIAPAARARLLATLGAIYQNLGLPQQGSATLAQAVEQARLGGDGATLVEALTALGLSLDERGQFAEAEQALAEAMQLRRERGELVAAALAQASVGLAQTRSGRLEEAERSLLDAHAALAGQLGADAPDTLRVAAYRTEVMRETGREEEARALLESVLPRLELELPADDPGLLELHGYYGNLLLQLDETALAQQVFERMLAQRRRLLEADRSPLGFVHNGLGTLYYQQGRTRDAAEQFAQTLAIGERTLAPGDPALAIDLNNVAALHEEMGDYASAEPLMRRAVAIMQGAAAERRVLFAQYRQNLGRLLMLAGQAEEALGWLQAPIPDEQGDSWELQRARQTFHLAEWHRRFGDAAEAANQVAATEARVEALGGTGSARYGALLRTRGLLAFAGGDTSSARTLLQQARELLAASRGERYIGVAEIDLDLAELAIVERKPVAAGRRLRAAAPVIDAVAVAHAPQRQRLARLREAVAAL
jgi:eukaryotic-like serine/threonine-protein kinase